MCCPKASCTPLYYRQMCTLNACNGLVRDELEKIELHDGFVLRQIGYDGICHINHHIPSSTSWFQSFVFKISFYISKFPKTNAVIRCIRCH